MLLSISVYVKHRQIKNNLYLTVIRCFWWVLICFDRWSDLINFLLHSGHWNLFSPVCVLLCRCNSSDRVNRLPQKSQVQTNGRSPVCHLKCARKCDVLPYTLLQPAIWQICCFLRSVCLSPSAQFGHVHATLRTLCFCDPSWLVSPEGELTFASVVVLTTTPGVRVVACGWEVVTFCNICHLLGSVGSCWMCWPTVSCCGAGCCVITCTFPSPGVKNNCVQ